LLDDRFASPLKRDAAASVISEMMAMRSFTHLMQSGGVQHWERVSVAVATEQVLATTRQAWLRVLERWSAAWYERFMRKKPRKRDYTEITIINSEIKRLRRVQSGRAARGHREPPGGSCAFGWTASGSYCLRSGSGRRRTFYGTAPL
jgi:hypothetical protein